MAVGYVGDAQASASSVALPAFTAGDLAIVFAYRNNNATAPSLPSGWTNIGTAGANTNSVRWGYRLLVGGDTTTSTWTNATHICVIILNGHNATQPIGASASINGSGSTLTTPALALQHPGFADSWVVAFAGTKATDANTKTLAGTTDEASSVTALNLATGRGISSWAQTNYSATVNANANEMVAVEVLVAASYARATQAGVETAYTPVAPNARVTQAGVEVAYRPATPVVTGSHPVIWIN